MKKTMSRRCIWLGTSMLAMPMWVSPADAQSAQSVVQTAPSTGSNLGGLEEIVVTAQRREERSVDVPISITALSRRS
jgi:iron complex outermembrane receptor protein